MQNLLEHLLDLATIVFLRTYYIPNPVLKDRGGRRQMLNKELKSQGQGNDLVGKVLAL